MTGRTPQPDWPLSPAYADAFASAFAANGSLPATAPVEVLVSGSNHARVTIDGAVIFDGERFVPPDEAKAMAQLAPIAA